MKHNFNLNQIILLCENGEVTTDDGTKFQITEVKSETVAQDYSHLIGKWVRSLFDDDEGKFVKIISKINQNVFEIEKQEHMISWYWRTHDTGNVQYSIELLDLSNPLDYNPTELVGKYWNGIKLGELRYDLNVPFYYTETIPISCKEVKPSEVTETPPAKSLKYEDIVGEVKPLFYSASDGKIYSVTDYIKGCCENTVATQRDAKKLRATAQLLVVMHAANGGEWIPKEGEERVVILCRQFDNSFYFSVHEGTLHQIYFRTREDAEKALSDNKQLFNEYFGIDE